MAKPQYGAAHRRRRAEWKLELTRTGGRRCACRGQCGRHRGRCREWITAASKNSPAFSPRTVSRTPILVSS